MGNTINQIYNVLRTYHDLLKERKPGPQSIQAMELPVDHLSISIEGKKNATPSTGDSQKPPFSRGVEPVFPEEIVPKKRERSQESLR